MPNILDQVKTVILMMMENRSFDHMLGHLTLDNPALKIEGLRQEDMASYSNDYNDTLYPLFPITVDKELDSDIPHEFDAVATQLGTNPVNGRFTMHGFVEAYAKAGNIINPDSIPMGYFNKEQVPVTNFLARNFCVCDHWFSSIPTSTQPNRTMALCGESSIYQTLVKPISVTNNVFDWMEDNDIRWRAYHDAFPFYALYPKLWKYVLGNKYRSYQNFYQDQLAPVGNDDPEVIIIEPCYEDAPHFPNKQPNDNHAPLAIGFGEEFIRSVYLAITANPERWQQSLLILYYDEHGGFYDHVAPPTIPYKTVGGESYSFRSLGPRIPGLIISPFVKPGSVFSSTLDHTSVLQLLAEKFNKPPVSANVEVRKKLGIHNLSEALDVSVTSKPPLPPMQPINVQTALGRYINTSAGNNMKQAFTDTANQLMVAHSNEVKEKYPELEAWQNIQQNMNK
jgi:phospholipase C